MITMRHLLEKEGLPADPDTCGYSLIFAGTLISGFSKGKCDDSRTLRDYGIHREATIHW